MEDGVTLSGKELERLRVLVAVGAGELSRVMAARQLGVSVRQLKGADMQTNFPLLPGDVPTIPMALF